MAVPVCPVAFEEFYIYKHRALRNRRRVGRKRFRIKHAQEKGRNMSWIGLVTLFLVKLQETSMGDVQTR